MNNRKGKITGTRLKDIVVKRGTGQKIGFYEIIAERLARPESEYESAMERGHELEAEAIENFAKNAEKKVNTDLVFWTRDDNENIAISPDGVIGDTEAVEVKCLSSSRHVEALITQEIPKEHRMQMLQYFIVNEKLDILYFVFYDPRLIVKQMFYITVKREDIEDEIAEYLEYQRNILSMIDEHINELTF